MTPNIFAQFTTALFENCNSIMNSKGPDYSGMEDRLLNFKDAGLAAGITPIQACFVYLQKHWCAVEKFARGEKLSGEPIEEKLKDVINYCVLMLALIEDAKTNQSGGVRET